MYICINTLCDNIDHFTNTIKSLQSNPKDSSLGASSSSYFPGTVSFIVCACTWGKDDYTYFHVTVLRIESDCPSILLHWYDWKDLQWRADLAASGGWCWLGLLSDPDIHSFVLMVSVHVPN